MKTIYRILLWLFIIIVVAVAITMTYKDVTKNLEPKKKEAFVDEPKRLKITLFYATWCGHCEKYISSNSPKDKNKFVFGENPFANLGKNPFKS